jgi:hypothetical protein
LYGRDGRIGDIRITARNVSKQRLPLFIFVHSIRMSRQNQRSDATHPVPPATAPARG